MSVSKVTRSVGSKKEGFGRNYNFGTVTPGRFELLKIDLSARNLQDFYGDSSLILYWGAG